MEKPSNNNNKMKNTTEKALMRQGRQTLNQDSATFFVFIKPATQISKEK